MDQLMTRHHIEPFALHTEIVTGFKCNGVYAKVKENSLTYIASSVLKLFVVGSSVVCH